MSSHPCFFSDCEYFRGVKKRGSKGVPLLVSCEVPFEGFTGLYFMSLRLVTPANHCYEVVKNETL